MVCALYVEYIVTYYLKRTQRKVTYISGLAVVLVFAYVCVKSVCYWSTIQLHDMSSHSTKSSARRGDTWRRSKDVNYTRRHNGKGQGLSMPANSYFKRRSWEVTPHNYPFVIRNEQLCTSPTPFLLIIVPSVYHHTEIRNAIRQTWASIASSKLYRNERTHVAIKLAFLFGTLPTVKSNHILLKEQEKYGDIVQEDFVDVYFNLTIKIVAALRWVALYCSAVEFILKADEDVFVNIPLLVETLRRGGNRDSIIGHVEHMSKVPRHGKWIVMKGVYPFDIYPDYTQGNAYIIPGHLASTMFNTSKFLPYLPIEDVFITGVLRKTIGVKLINEPRFTFLIESPINACELSKGNVISITNVNLNDFYALWEMATSTVVSCSSS